MSLYSQCREGNGIYRKAEVVNMLPLVDHVNNEEEGIFGFTLDKGQGSG